MKITIRNFQKKIPISPAGIKKAILRVFSKEGLKKSGEITISFVGDKKIRELNLQYLHKDRPTDVLAFNLSEPQDKEMAADIVVSVDTAIHNAKIFKTTPVYELYLYAVHGMLHILGYNDRNERERKIMREKTNNILTKNANFR